jgi:hypothetical protein
MSIAQRFVAGEGELHPASGEMNETAVDSAAVIAFRCDSTNLPWVIFRAAFRAAHIEEIPARARAVLSALARTVDAERPFAPIFARRDLLTGRALQSMRTFYRSLDDLESAGLIERRPQSRYLEAGLFGRAYLHLTEHAAALLGLAERLASNAATQALESTPALSPASGVQRDAPFSGPSANLADGGIYKDLTPTAFQKRQPGEVPEDLQRLRSLGFIDFLIFKLMREARENGKRLSDVVEATWDHLKAAKAPINYLRTLLQSPADFGHQLRRKVAAQAEERSRLDRAARAEQVAQQSAGQTFFDANAQRKYVVDANAQSMMIYAVDEDVGRQAAGWKENFAEALQRGLIRTASQDDLNAFAKARRLQPPQTFQPKRGGRHADEKPEVTPQVRDHIAALRSILRPYGRAFTTAP